jgi:hypothetical protein
MDKGVANLCYNYVSFLSQGKLIWKLMGTVIRIGLCRSPVIGTVVRIGLCRTPVTGIVIRIGL